jgi:hypothetical protein
MLLHNNIKKIAFDTSVIHVVYLQFVFHLKKFKQFLQANTSSKVQASLDGNGSINLGYG